VALDTAAKRFSAMHVMCPWRALSVVPSGTIDQAERQAASWLYSGILAGAPVAPPAGGPVWVWVNGESFPPGDAVQGTQGYWMCINGVWIKAHASAAPWPRRCRNNGPH
jgi:hypothetical protein